METKHTKGKWFVERTSIPEGDFQGRVLEESSETMDVHHPEKPQIYIIVHNIHHEGNAKLIAAAPEMLKSIDLLYKLCQTIAGKLKPEQFDEVREFWNEAMGQAEDSVKKATE